jgi:GH35 family endo-1,4-beta-xylanase
LRTAQSSSPPPWGNRLDDYVKHIRDLLDAGVPLSGIGAQKCLGTAHPSTRNFARQLYSTLNQ